MLTAPDQEISLTDPDFHSMVASGRGSGVIAYAIAMGAHSR